MIRTPGVIVCALAAFALAGCSTSTTAANSPATPSSAAPAPATPVAADPAPAAVGLSCADIGGVFTPHYPDGTGDCMSADPRPKCHVKPAEQDGNYIAEVTMTPPNASGTVDYPGLLKDASNADCWHVPAN